MALCSRTDITNSRNTFAICEVMQLRVAGYLSVRTGSKWIKVGYDGTGLNPD